MKLQTAANYIAWFIALVFVVVFTGNSLRVVLLPTTQPSTEIEKYERKLTYHEGILFKTNCSQLSRNIRRHYRPQNLLLIFLEPPTLVERSYYTRPDTELCKQLLGTNFYSYFTSRNYDNIPRTAIFQIGIDPAEQGKSSSEIRKTQAPLAETGLAIPENALFFQILDLSRNNEVYIDYRDSLSRSRTSILVTPHIFTALAWLNLLYLLIVYRQKILAIRETLLGP